MAKVLTRQRQKFTAINEDISEVREATPEELFDIFDRDARQDLGVSGDEFLRAWFAGEWEGRADPDAISCAMMVPFVEDYWRTHIRPG